MNPDLLREALERRARLGNYRKLWFSCISTVKVADIDPILKLATLMNPNRGCRQSRATTKGDRLELLDELAFTRSMAIKSSLLLVVRSAKPVSWQRKPAIRLHITSTPKLATTIVSTTFGWTWSRSIARS